MTQYSWTDDLYTGSSLIDSDHRKLVDLVNAFFQSMQSGQDNERMSKEWLRDHILAADMKLAAALKSRRSVEPAPQLH